MSQSVESDVNNAMVQFTNRESWKKWGMDALREQGPAFLLEGPPGTGKTTIARYIAKKIGKGFKQLETSTLMNEGSPGATELKVQEFFEDCRNRKNCTIFMDECEAVLISRDQIGEAGRTWQLGTVNKIIACMNTYKGLILAATNHPQLMDPALTDRFLAIIKVGRPDLGARKRLWRQKLPKSFPLQTSNEIIAELAQFDLSGRQIENAIVNCASNAIREGKKPTVGMMKTFCIRETRKHI